jgi:Flp pilus assembly protein CpaB
VPNRSNNGKSKLPDLSEFDPPNHFAADAGTDLEDYEEDLDSAVENKVPSFSKGAVKKTLREEKVKQTKSNQPKTQQNARWRFFFGIFLFIVGLGGSLWLVSSSMEGVEVVVVTREIQPGQLITGSDLSTARINVAPNYAATLIDSREASKLVGQGKVAARLLRPSQPVMKGDIVSATELNKTGVPEGFVAIALPVSASTAASRINRDDQVTLLFVSGKGEVGEVKAGNEGKAVILAEGVKVLEVSRASSSFSLNSSGNSANATPKSGGTINNLTLLVTLEQAQALARAKESGTIDVVLLPLALPESSTSLPTTPGANLTPNANPTSQSKSVAPPTSGAR